MSLLLPDPIPYSEGWDRFIADAYAEFHTGLRAATWFGMNVAHDTRKFDDRCEGFWHCVTKDSKEGEERLPNLDRCARVNWIGPLVEGCESGKSLCWKAPRLDRRGNIRVLISPMDFSHAVVLSPRQGKKSNYAFLVTAYVVEPHRKKTLRKQYATEGDYRPDG